MVRNLLNRSILALSVIRLRNREGLRKCLTNKTIRDCNRSKHSVSKNTLYYHVILILKRETRSRSNDGLD